MVATAELIVDQYSAGDVAAMAVGDRDMALGLETIRALAKRARFPLISANLVDAGSKAPILPTHVVVERAGLKIGLIGLMSQAGARNTLASIPSAEGSPGWDVTDPVPAAVAAVEALAKEGVDVVVALSHLTPQEQAAVSKAAPSIRVFLGGQSMGMRAPAGAVETGSVAVEGGMKGKQVGLLTLQLAAGVASNAPIVDKDRKKNLEDRLARARVRVESLEKRVADAKERASAATEGAADADAGSAEPSRGRPPRRVNPPISLWEQQLAGTRAEVQMVEADLAALADAPDGPANAAVFELVNLGKDVADDPAVKAEVDAFRVKYPDPTKQHAAPQVRHPAPGMGIQPPGSGVKVSPGAGVKPMPPARRVRPIRPIRPTPSAPPRSPTP